MPQKQKIAETKKTETSKTAGTPEVMKDAETGKLTGITTPDGQRLMNLSPGEVRALAEKYNAQTATPQGFVDAEQQAVLRQQQLQQANILQSPGMEMTADGRQVVQEGGIMSNVATGAAAIGGGIVGAKAGAAAGAALGSFLAPGVGTIIGGIVGGVGGAIGGAYVKQRIQKTQSIKQANKVFTTAKTNKAEILNMINAGLVTEGQARSFWIEDKKNIAASQAYLKRQTQNDEGYG
jgi:hypothetical protein